MIPFNLIFILTFGTLASTRPCSRAQSKFVREYFARSLLPVYQKYSQPIPESCPFSPIRDIYHFHENNKTKLDIYRWKCELCGKLFAKESDLDKHFDNRHNNTLQTGKNSICLANYCRIFRCDALNKPSVQHNQCHESTMNILRNKCKEHIDLCVPKSASLSIQNKLTIDLRDKLCSFLTCSRVVESPDFMQSGTSFLQVFAIVFVIVLSIIAYVVINYTDLIFDENEMASLNEKIQNYETMKQQASKNKIRFDEDLNEKFYATENLRHRKVDENSSHLK